MTTDEIRDSFIRFFQEKEHTHIASDSLVPTNDPSLLFTGAGMNQFKDEFLGRGRPGLKRAVTAQKCLRTGDFDNVGRTAAHHTFFEMMGNFSFGDYFKEQSIVWGWEWLLEWMKLDPDRLSVSVYEQDEEAYALWRDKIKLPQARIYRYGEHDNFWPADAPSQAPAGTLCGPCSEIFFDQGPNVGCRQSTCQPSCDCDRFVEIWNLVFQQFQKGESPGELISLKNKNIDTGLGLERMAAVIQGVLTNFDTDNFQRILRDQARRMGVTYGQDPMIDRKLKRISDHIRGAVFAITDGVVPGNEGRRYVVRRLIRNAVLDGYDLGMREPFLHDLVPMVTNVMKSAYSELVERQDTAQGFIRNEEEAFLKTLEKGQDLFENEVQGLQEGGKLSGKTVFTLYATYGFPWQLTAQRLREAGKSFDEKGFEEEMSRHRALSSGKIAGIFGYDYNQQVKAITQSTRFVGYETCETQAKILAMVVGEKDQGRLVPCMDSVGQPCQLVLDCTSFYAESGGQVGDRGKIDVEPEGVFRVNDVQKEGEIFFHAGILEKGRISVGQIVQCRVDTRRRMDIAKNHTATHLLHHVIRKVLGSHAEQSGSRVDADRFSLDFTHFKALSQEQLDQVERQVNEMICEDLPVETEITTTSEAKSKGAIALFGEKYGQSVRLVSIADRSIELCGGTHVSRIGQIGPFKILSEESVAAGIRRIVAVSGMHAYEQNKRESILLKAVRENLRIPAEEVPGRVSKLLDQVRSLEQELRKAREAAVSGGVGNMEPVDVEGIRVLAMDLGQMPAKDLLSVGDRLKKNVDVLCLTSRDGEKASIICWVLTKEAQDRGCQASVIVQSLSQEIDGKGGGSPTMARGGGKASDKLTKAMRRVPEWVRRQVQ